MYMPYLVRFILIVVAVAIFGTLVALWVSGQLTAAEKRRAQITWGRPPGDDWPDEPGQATLHFFGVQEVPYDPDADATMFINRMTEDNIEFMLALGTDKETRPNVAVYSRRHSPGQHSKRAYRGHRRSGHTLPISWAPPRGTHRAQH